MVAVGLALEIEKVLHCCLCRSWEGSVTDHTSCPAASRQRLSVVWEASSF